MKKNEIIRKIYITGYTNNNLGDDIFFKILCNRYLNCIFYINFNKYNKSLYNIKNLKIINDKLYRGFCKIMNMHIKTTEKLQEMTDYTVQIGGSLFMEQDLYQVYNYKNNYFVLGSNFGPYRSDKFYNEYKNYFKNAQDVCFRDIYSYDLFKDLSNVRHASDIVFSLNKGNINITNNRKVVISIINCSKKAKDFYTSKYEASIIKLIEFFKNKNYDVVLMSFCKAEGDEIAINNIFEKISNKERILKYFYRGNIEEALNIIGDSQIVVGTRFHANILGLIMNKTVIPIAYSDKTINVLKDMNFKGKVFDIRDMDSFDINSLTDEDLNYKLDVYYQIKDAERHFEVLDKILERNEKND